MIIVFFFCIFILNMYNYCCLLNLLLTEPVISSWPPATNGRKCSLKDCWRLKTLTLTVKWLLCQFCRRWRLLMLQRNGRDMFFIGLPLVGDNLPTECRPVCCSSRQPVVIQSLILADHMMAMPFNCSTINLNNSKQPPIVILSKFMSYTKKGKAIFFISVFSNSNKRSRL